jgi:hypothetical protein
MNRSDRLKSREHGGYRPLLISDRLKSREHGGYKPLLIILSSNVLAV